MKDFTFEELKPLKEEEIPRVKLKIKNSLEKAKQSNYIRIETNDLKDLIKECCGYVDEFSKHRDLIINNVRDSIENSKYDKLLGCGNARLEKFIGNVEHNIKNPNYVMKKDRNIKIKRYHKNKAYRNISNL